MPKKIKGKNPDKMCQLIFLRIYPQQQKKWHKNSLYICWKCQTIYSNSYLNLHNIHLLHLFVDMYILKFLLKNHDFSRLIFSFQKFQEMGTKSIFLSSKIAFQLVNFQYLKNHLTKIVHRPRYGIIFERSKCWEN